MSVRHSAPGRHGLVQRCWARVRRNLRFVVTALVVVLFIVALSWFVHDSSAGSGDGHRAAGGGPTFNPSAGVAPSPTPTPSPSPSSSHPPSRGATVTGAPSTLPRYTFTPGEPGGFTYVNLPTHSLVLEATSSAPISGVAWLVPTSTDHSYGKAFKVGTAWSLHTSVIGKPYYAALFVQAGPAGVPITCTIVLDGRVASRLTTSGPYGRQVCIA